jgi:hypothetical protein
VQVYAFLLRHFNEHVVMTTAGAEKRSWTWRRYTLYVLALVALAVYLGYVRAPFACKSRCRKIHFSAAFSSFSVVGLERHAYHPQQDVPTAKALLGY